MRKYFHLYNHTEQEGESKILLPVFGLLLFFIEFVFAAMRRYWWSPVGSLEFGYLFKWSFLKSRSKFLLSTNRKPLELNSFPACLTAFLVFALMVKFSRGWYSLVVLSFTHTFIRFFQCIIWSTVKLKTIPFASICFPENGQSVTSNLMLL